MRKQQPSNGPHSQRYSEKQLAGLRTYTLAQKQATVDRLRTAIASLQAKQLPISARTLWEECGLAYNSIKRNPEALALFQEHSVSLKAKRKRANVKSEPSIPHDRLLAYKKTQLAAQVHEERKLRQDMEAQYTKLLEDYVQRDIKIAELEAELAQYRSHLGQFRTFIQQQEHHN